MRLLTEPYLEQLPHLPKTGRVILAQYDDEHVIVYQAYRPNIGRFAAENGYLGGDGFSLNRMSWIKPNFLWMMFRSGWGMKEGQESTLAIWLERRAFDSILEQAVHSSFVPEVYDTVEDWQEAVRHSDVRLQWDPDHNPSGNKIERRAIQLGLRGETLQLFAQGNWMAHIEDISPFVSEQRKYARSPYNQLVVPHERVYPGLDEQIAARLQLTTTST